MRSIPNLLHLDLGFEKLTFPKQSYGRENRERSFHLRELGFLLENAHIRGSVEFGSFYKRVRSRSMKNPKR